MISQRFLLLTGIVFLEIGCSTRKPSLPPVVHPPVTDGPIRVTEQAEAGGLNCRLGHGNRSPLTILDTAGGGAALLDYNGDGWLDILIVGEHRLWLFRNRGGFRFEDVSADSGIGSLTQGNATSGLTPIWMGCAVGDVDNDGFPDIYVTGYACSLLLHNQDGNTFQDISEAAGVRNRSFWETSAAFFDADRDGRLDLYVARYVRFGPQDIQVCNFRGVDAACPPHYYEAERGVFYKNLTLRGTLSKPRRYPVQEESELPDRRANQNQIRFVERTQNAGLDTAQGKGLGVAVADGDGDGWPDLYIANDGVPADHFRNRGDGRFQAIGLEAGTAYTAEGRTHAGMGVDWGDADNDLRPDLIVTAFQHEGCALYYNQGKSVFVEASEEAGLRLPTLRRLGFGIKFADFDNDGRLDLLLANGHVQDTIHRFDETATYAQPPQVFHNAGQGLFRDVSLSAGESFQRTIVGRALCVGDLDNDGRLDAVIVDLEGAPLLMHNETPPRHHWLGLRLIGAQGAGNGEGAMVMVQTSEGRQRREVQTSGSYLSAGDPRLHFGLGGDRVAQRVSIRWPSGRVEDLNNVTADRWLTVREGRGIVQSR